MIAAPKYSSLWKSHCRDNFVCRTRTLWREANVPGEEAGKCTWKTQWSMGPSICARIAEIISGRAVSPSRAWRQSAKTQRTRENQGVGRDTVWRMSPYEL